MSGPLGGIAFPFRITARGSVCRASGREKLRQDLRHLLSTRLGERVMLRGYGCGVHHRVQDPNDASLSALIRHEMEESIRQYLPEVQLTAPIRLNAEDEILTIVLEYSVDGSIAVDRAEFRIS